MNWRIVWSSTLKKKDERNNYHGGTMSTGTEELTGISFSLSENQRMVRDLARDFAEKEIKPHVGKYDESQEFPSGTFRKLGEVGFLGSVFPERYGGAGMNTLDFVVMMEEISKVDPSVGLGLGAHNGLCTSHIYLFGNDDQKEKYLPDLCSGRKLGGWGLTEPGSGSDAGGMGSVAERNGDRYILNGNKTFCTHGSVGGLFVVMAKTDKTKGKESIAAFILEKGMEGFSVGKKEDKLGMRASDTATLIFENVEVPAENRLGEEGEGFVQALKVLDGGRIGIAALSVGIAQAALEHSLKYARERKQFGKSLAEFQAIQFKLADMHTEIEAARLLTYEAAYRKDKGLDYTLAASKAKYFASEVAARAASESVQIHGGYGFIKEYPVEKLYRDVKLMTIGEGTSEVQKMVIARQLLQK
jgi:alkylation response protein AidB-like acyl-CoA dehydrogenase